MEILAGQADLNSHIQSSPMAITKGDTTGYDESGI